MSEKDKVPIVHLDDVYVGKVIESAGLSQEMDQSISICTGFHALKSENGLNDKWSLAKEIADVCTFAGLVVFHRMKSANEAEFKIFIIFRIPPLAILVKDRF